MTRWSEHANKLVCTPAMGFDMPSIGDLSLPRSAITSIKIQTRGIELISEQVFVVGAAVVLILSSLLPIWTATFPPLQDYPNHLLSAHMAAHYNDPNFDYAQNFILEWRPVPNMLGHAIIAGLAYIVPTPLAGKLCLSLYIILFPLSIFYLISAVDSNKLLLGLFSFPLIYNWFFNMGFLNFCLSLPLYFLAAGFWWKTRSDSPHRARRRAILGLLTFLVYLSHFVTFGTWLITIGLLSVISYGWLDTIKRGLLLGVWAVAILTPATMLCDVVRTQIEALLDLITPSVIAFASLPTKLMTAYQPFISFRALVEGTVLLILVILYLVLLLRNIAQRNASPFLAVTLALVGLYLVLPVGFRALFYIASRLLILAVILGLPTLYVPRRFRWRVILGGFLVVMSITHITLMLGVYHRANGELSDYYAGLQHIPPQQAVLPISRVHRGYVYYQEHVWAYYHIEKGGLSPGVFTGRDQLLSYRFRPPLPYDEDVLYAGAMARRNLYVFLSGQASDSMRTALLSRGFEPWIFLGDNVLYKAARNLHYKDTLDASLVVENYPYITIYGPEDADVDPYLLKYYRLIFAQGQMRVLERVARVPMHLGKAPAEHY